MKKITTIVLLLLSAILVNAQSNLGVGTATPDASAKLDVTSSTQGILIPRMKTTDRTAIASPAKGLMVYDSTLKAFYYHNGTAWNAVGAASTSSFPSIELRVTKTAAQTLVGTDVTQAQTTTGEAVVYSATNHTNAALTGGNTWDGTTFTVGSTGAGWYQLTSQLMANNTVTTTANNTMSMLIEINAAAGSSIFGTTTYTIANVAMQGFSVRSVAIGLVYLAAGDVVKIKAKGNAATAILALRTDGSTNFSVVRLK